MLAVLGGLSVIARGTLVLLVATFGLILLTFALRMILGRGFSIPEWNALSLALTLDGVLTAVVTLGPPNAVARSIPYAAPDVERKNPFRGAAQAGPK